MGSKSPFPLRRQAGLTLEQWLYPEICPVVVVRQGDLPGASKPNPGS
jgi:hypothetical protein